MFLMMDPKKQLYRHCVNSVALVFKNHEKQAISIGQLN